MIKLFSYLLIVIFSFSPSLAIADDAVSPLTLSDFNYISSFLVSAFYVFGLYLVLNGLYSFKLMPDSPQQYPARVNAAKMCAGFALLSSAYFYAMMMSTATGEAVESASSVLSSNGHLVDQLTRIEGSFLAKYIPEHTSRTLLGILFIIGLGSFLKGLALLSEVGSPQNNGTSPFKRSMSHIIGGMVCMNITAVSCFIGKMLGIGVMCL
jgi:hypothetical protein